MLNVNAYKYVPWVVSSGKIYMPYPESHSTKTFIGEQ